LTNNGLESLNAQIKLTGTFREQLSIKEFFSRAIRIVNDWSKERNPLIEVLNEENDDVVCFRNQHFLVKKDYENGYNYREKLFEEENSVIF
jgi:hypothetical protein